MAATAALSYSAPRGPECQSGENPDVLGGAARQLGLDPTLEKKDLAVHMGQSYTLEAIHFNGTPTMVTAVANGELESLPSPSRPRPSRSRTRASTI